MGTPNRVPLILQKFSHCVPEFMTRCSLPKTCQNFVLILLTQALQQASHVWTCLRNPEPIFESMQAKCFADSNAASLATGLSVVWYFSTALLLLDAPNLLSHLCSAVVMLSSGGSAMGTAADKRLFQSFLLPFRIVLLSWKKNLRTLFFGLACSANNTTSSKTPTCA